MSSFFEDLKLLHPYLELPSSSESSAWKEKLIDSTISLDEWSAHAKLLLRDVGGTDYYSLFADIGPVTLDHDSVFSTAIIEYMLKDVTKTIVRCADETYIKHMSYWLPGWQEICEWPTETRYARFDQFFDFIATICRWFVPAQAEKGRNTLACATLIEVHYLMLLLDYSSKTYKSHKKNEDGGKKRDFKRLLDSAFDIFLRCDSALYTLTKFDKDWPLCCSSLKSRLTVAIYDAAKRYNIMPTHMHVNGVVKIGRDPVGIGGFADVWKGMMNGTVVALKVPRLHCEGVDLKIVEAQTCKEGFIWNQLSHKNILPLLGFYSTGNDPIIMVSPWMDNGNLTTYLQHNKSANRQELMYGVYKGLCYLHSREPPVAHGDLRCANILVNNEGKPLISDFGLSRVQGLQLSLPTGYASGVSGGSYRWLAPELWRDTGKHTTSSDVYAYAMTCLEVYSGKKPLGNYNEVQFMLKFAKGVVLEIPESIKTSNSLVAQERELWWQDLKRCCSADATNRPSTIEAIRMVCVFSPGLWQLGVCDSERDYDDLQAIRAHESCIPSECIWTRKHLSIVAKNNTASQFATKNIMYLLVEKVEGVSRQIMEGVDGVGESVGVRKMVMDGSAVVAERRQLPFVINAFGGKEMYYYRCKAWSQLHHRNILPLLGITKNITLVTPWIEYTTLESRLQSKHRHMISDPYQILYGVYNGLCYLHNRTPPMVHGKLCPSAILIDNLDNPLIADYAIAGVTDLYYPSQRDIGSEDPLTTMSDVFAFARICIKIYSRPIYYWTDVEDGPNIGYHHFFLHVPHNLKTSDSHLASMREKWWARLRTCLAVNPMDRPAVGDMKHMLYFPASVDDYRNEEHGYILGTDDDGSHGSCEDNSCFWIKNRKRKFKE